MVPGQRLPGVIDTAFDDRSLRRIPPGVLLPRHHGPSTGRRYSRLPMPPYRWQPGMGPDQRRPHQTSRPVPEPGEVRQRYADRDARLRRFGQSKVEVFKAGRVAETSAAPSVFGHAI